MKVFVVLSLALFVNSESQSREDDIYTLSRKENIYTQSREDDIYTQSREDDIYTTTSKDDVYIREEELYFRKSKLQLHLRGPKGVKSRMFADEAVRQLLESSPADRRTLRLPERFGPRKLRYIPQPTKQPESNKILGTIVNLSGGLLGIAGEVAKHAGNVLYNSGSLVRSGGEILTHVGVAVEHSGAVLNSASLVARHSGDLIHQDSRFATKAQRGLVCAFICPIRAGNEKRLCEIENCQSLSKQGRDLKPNRVAGRVGDQRSQEDQNIFGFGANLLVSGTRIISDIAFVKLRLLQGLFSTPDCTYEDINEIGCISAYCLLPDDEKISYKKTDGSCQEEFKQNEILISTSLGPVVGRKEKFKDERYDQLVLYLAFTGLPYARPPIGRNRYAPPRRVTPWKCPHDATRLRNKMCPQVSIGQEDEGLVPGSVEDCLYLNVYVPQPNNYTGIDTERLRPVLVYIHGGAFMFGSGSACWYGPEFWMIHDIVVVTFNYRLGPLGYLSLGNKDIPGNAGMLDQVQALQWIQENIRSYGGDPTQVTLMGQSAGSFSATYHLVSPLSRGLFKRVIAHSGVGGFSPSYHQYSTDQAVRFGAESAALIGCTEEDSQLKCLRKKPVSEIMSMDIRNEFLSQPVVDGNFSDNPFLPDDPRRMIKRGDYDKDVDILLGFNSQEGLMVTSLFKDFPLLYTAMAAGWPVLGPFSLLGRHHSDITEKDRKVVNEILRFYVGNVTDIGPEKLNNITDMYTDSFFSFGVHNFLKEHLKHTRGNTFQYVYSYAGESGPGHSAEIPLFWGTHKGKRWIKSKEELELSGQLTTIWSNFVKSGNPSPQPTTSFRSRSSRKISSEDVGDGGLSPVELKWTNLAKKENITLQEEEKKEVKLAEDFLQIDRVDRTLDLQDGETGHGPWEFLDISLNLKMQRSQNWEKRMKFWEDILGKV